MKPGKLHDARETTTPEGPREANLLPLVAAAARIGTSRHTLRTWAVYGHKLPFIRLGRKLLFDPRDLDEFVERNRVPARDDGAGLTQRRRR